MNLAFLSKVKSVSVRGTLSPREIKHSRVLNLSRDKFPLSLLFVVLNSQLYVSHQRIKFLLYNINRRNGKSRRARVTRAKLFLRNNSNYSPGKIIAWSVKIWFSSVDKLLQCCLQFHFSGFIFSQNFLFRYNARDTIFQLFFNRLRKIYMHYQFSTM